jgi:hypothetical protein
MQQGYPGALRPIPACAPGLVLALALVGCGGKPAGDDSQVRALLAKLAKATAAHDYRTLCEEVLATSLVKEVETAGVPCADALRAGLGSVHSPKLRVVRVRVHGKSAVATVHTSAAGQKASDDSVSLVKGDDGWRVSSLTK